MDITRYTAVQDAGRAIHPDYVEGQMQGGVAQGIGWALNEEYIYDEDGHLENPGFLDYRIPVASDLPMIDTIVVEVPIVPPMAAVANAIHDATGLRLNELPMSPPKVLAALAAKEENADAAECRPTRRGAVRSDVLRTDVAFGEVSLAETVNRPQAVKGVRRPPGPKQCPFGRSRHP